MIIYYIHYHKYPSSLNLTFSAIMTDNAILLNNQQKLSSDVMYSLKPSCVPCRSYRCSIPATSNSYAPTQTIECRIPARRNCFLDGKNSYIRYTLKNTHATQDMFLDHSAYSPFQSQYVYHGSNMLENIGNLNVLMPYIIDFQMDSAQKAGLETIYGFGTKDTRLGMLIPATHQRTFCLPIVGFLGTGSTKYTPLSLNDDILFQLQLGTLANTVVATATPGDWSIVSFELVLNILELDSVGMRMIEEVTPFTEPIFINATSFKNYANSVASSQLGNCTLPFSARLASMTGIISLPRCSDEAVITSYALSSRSSPNTERYNYTIGSLMCPNKPVILVGTNTGGFAEGFMENLRMWNNCVSPDIASSVTKAQYNIAFSGVTTSGIAARVASTTTTNNISAFAIACELCAIPNRDDVLLCGVNTLNQTCSLNYEQNTNITVGYTWDHFAMHDVILILDEHGSLSVRF
jgi:hypothetical protein